MRAGVRRELFARFSDRVEDRLSGFTALADKALGRHNALWRRQVTGEFFCFVLLTAFDNHDEFSIEVAWNVEGNFPWFDLNFKLQDVSAVRGRERLSLLWVANGRDQPWAVAPRETMQERGARLAAESRGEFQIARQMLARNSVTLEDAIARVTPLVEDAVGRLVEYGIPLFQRVASARGIEWHS